MNHLPIDPCADRSRRAWLPCPNCDHGLDCPQCRNRTNCPTHWQYLLANAGTRVSLQRPTCCAHLWSVDAARMRRRDRHVVGTIALDCHAHHVVASPQGDYVYATTAKSVNVIDRTHRVVARIPIGVDPKRTMVSPDGSRVYVMGYEGSLSIIDAVDYTVITAGRDASTAEVVGLADNYVYMAHNQGRNCWISAVAADGTTATVVPVDSYASALALSPDGSRLYVASSRPMFKRQRGHGSISIIDTATFTVIDVIALQFCADTITLSPDGSEVYATHYNKNAVSVIELASGSLTLIKLDDAPLDIVISPDGDRLYVTNLHTLALIDTATKHVESVPTCDLPRQLLISNDGNRAYVTDFRDESVWVLNPANKSIVTTIDLGSKPEVLALSADETLLYVADHLSPRLTVISLFSSHEPKRSE
jgi:YVTN family beta-propeller protein